MWFYHTVMCSKDADRMANSIDTDQPAPSDFRSSLIWLYTVSTDLPVQILRIITVNHDCITNWVSKKHHNYYIFISTMNFSWRNYANPMPKCSSRCANLISKPNLMYTSGTTHLFMKPSELSWTKTIKNILTNFRWDFVMDQNHKEHINKLQVRFCHGPKP